MTTLDSALVGRFAVDLGRLVEPETKLGIAVSGGPDSVALLLLAAAARKGAVAAATVDHGLRPESRGEAEWVATLCRSLDVPHAILSIDWEEPPATALQERARIARYDRLGDWMKTEGLTHLCTGHHQGDQAETMMMRLSRGSGLRGLSGMRATAAVPGHSDLTLLRPLLTWSREELAGICASAGIDPVDDASNQDARFERVRVREWIRDAGLDTAALAKSAELLREAEGAIEWSVDREWSDAVAVADGGLDYRVTAVPPEIRRRIVSRALAQMAREGEAEIRGAELGRLLQMLESGGVATLRGVRCEGGTTWRFRHAPGRLGTVGNLD